MSNFKIYLESPIFKKGDVIQNNRRSTLIVIKTYKIWWKTLLMYLTFKCYKPYKSPYIYIVKHYDVEVIKNLKTKENEK